jgi:acyl-CoA thioester hydrolase
MSIVSPFKEHRGQVLPEWIDYNGHMNVAFYVLAFDRATDDFFDHLGLTREYRDSTGCTTFALESHISYLRELKLDEPYEIHTQLIDHDEKRIHFFHYMVHADEGYLAATIEILSMHIDRSGPKAVPLPPAIAQRTAAVSVEHLQLPKPKQLGSKIGIRRS